MLLALLTAYGSCMPLIVQIYKEVYEGSIKILSAHYKEVYNGLN